MKVVITPRAQAELRDIALWIAGDSPDRALSFFFELREACLDLGDLAYAYPVIRKFRKFALRRRAFRGYLILYRINDVVEVLRVLHGARDIDAAVRETADH